MTAKSFSDYEREGFDRKASMYDEFVLPATEQGIAPVLDALGDLAGLALLDVACGTGHLARQAVTRGAHVTGVDFAPAIIGIARDVAPAARFEVADARDLPFEDDCFDAVTCNFGLLHVEHQERAMQEAARVLKPGGRFIFTVWDGPANGSEFMALILGAYQEHADMNVDLPAAPPLFQLADPSIRDPMLANAGFAVRDVCTLAIEWPLNGPETPFDFIDKGAVRTSMIYAKQTPEVQKRIRQSLRAGTQAYLDAGRSGIPAPAVLVSSVLAAR